ncbi:unnamed protein product [Arctia plantaginis]|uniref:Uncharacterized protein n=1 Tax=Arctia plantaginis TaxID=874455 RepID=A0A8S0ZUS9_ARCPL|nr:unnamed protein product [Arctia plantaginis]CAB3238495.1 unnamed protein product [Arctia plantaginis]
MERQRAVLSRASAAQGACGAGRGRAATEQAAGVPGRERAASSDAAGCRNHSERVRMRARCRSCTYRPPTLHWRPA